jgi:hypothetical protein
VDILSDVVTAVGAAILTPVWAVTTARGRPATASVASLKFGYGLP